jgi:hypothetical protein
MSLRDEIAASLNGIQNPRNRILPADIAAMAKREGVLVVYGASDDLMEFEGAFHDEFDCYEGGTAWIHAGGILTKEEIDLDDDDDSELLLYAQRKAAARTIRAIWDSEGYSWTYKTDIPHVTFDMMEDGEKYCRGIVFNVADIDPRPAATPSSAESPDDVKAEASRLIEAYLAQVEIEGIAFVGSAPDGQYEATFAFSMGPEISIRVHAEGGSEVIAHVIASVASIRFVDWFHRYQRGDFRQQEQAAHQTSATAG